MDQPLLAMRTTHTSVPPRTPRSLCALVSGVRIIDSH